MLLCHSLCPPRSTVFKIVRPAADTQQCAPCVPTSSTLKENNEKSDCSLLCSQYKARCIRRYLSFILTYYAGGGDMGRLPGPLNAMKRWNVVAMICWSLLWVELNTYSSRYESTVFILILPYISSVREGTDKLPGTVQRGTAVTLRTCTTTLAHHLCWWYS